jgi:hypothetical protein
MSASTFLKDVWEKTTLLGRLDVFQLMSDTLAHVSKRGDKRYELKRERVEKLVGDAVWKCVSTIAKSCIQSGTLLKINVQAVQTRIKRREMKTIARIASIDPSVKEQLQRSCAFLFEDCEDESLIDMIVDKEDEVRLQGKLKIIEKLENMDPTERLITVVQLYGHLEDHRPNSCLENELDKRIRNYIKYDVDIEPVTNIPPTHLHTLQPITMISTPQKKKPKKVVDYYDTKTLSGLLYLFSKPWKPIQLLLFFEKNPGIWASIHHIITSNF